MDKDKVNKDKVNMDGGLEKGTLHAVTASTSLQQSPQVHEQRRHLIIDGAYRAWREGSIDDEELLLMIHTAYRRYPCSNTPISD